MDGMLFSKVLWTEQGNCVHDVAGSCKVASQPNTKGLEEAAQRIVTTC